MTSKRNRFARTPKNFLDLPSAVHWNRSFYQKNHPNWGGARSRKILPANLRISIWAGTSRVFPHDDMAAVDAASVILGGGASSRLYQQLREKEGLVYGVGAYAYTPGFPGLLTVSGQCAKEVADLVPNRIVECVNDRRQSRFSEEELRKAKRIITVNAIEQFQTVKGLASDLGLNWLYARNLDFSHALFGAVAGRDPGGC